MNLLLDNNFSFYFHFFSGPISPFDRFCLVLIQSYPDIKRPFLLNVFVNITYFSRLPNEIILEAIDEVTFNLVLP